jgi:hypothetical protein
MIEIGSTMTGLKASAITNSGSNKNISGGSTNYNNKSQIHPIISQFQHQPQQNYDYDTDEISSVRGSAQSNTSSVSSNISTAILKYRLLENLELDLDYLDDNTNEQNRFQKWKGSHSFICKGLLMLGPSNDHLIVTIALMVGIWIGHLILVGPFIGGKKYYYLSIILCVINLFTLFLTASTDPG